MTNKINIFSFGLLVAAALLFNACRKESDLEKIDDEMSSSELGALGACKIPGNLQEVADKYVIDPRVPVKPGYYLYIGEFRVYTDEFRTQQELGAAMIKLSEGTDCENNLRLAYEAANKVLNERGLPTIANPAIILEEVEVKSINIMSIRASFLMKLKMLNTCPNGITEANKQLELLYTDYQAKYKSDPDIAIRWFQIKYDFLELGLPNIIREKCPGVTPPDPTGGGGGVSYIPTVADIKLVEQVIKENAEEDARLAKDPLCYGTGRSGNVKFPGTAEHWLIQFDYVNTVIGGAREYSIPGAGSTGRRGYADIVNTFTNEMFEIKPLAFDNGAALAEVNLYIRQAQLACPPSNNGSWHAGSNYPATGKFFPHPTKPGKVLKGWLAAPGVIKYDVLELSNSPQPVPVLMPQNLADKLRDFVRLLATSTSNIETQIVYFLRRNPEMIPYLKAAAIGVVIGTIVEDIGSAGLGVADDWASFIIARTMWRLASAM